jgi:hypothetical protein
MGNGPGRCLGAVLVLTGAALPVTAPAQTRSQVETERREFAEWLRTAPVSPLRAVVVRPIGPGLSVGPDTADLPLAGVRPGRLVERDGRVSLAGAGDALSLVRGRPTVLLLLRSGKCLRGDAHPGA